MTVRAVRLPFTVVLTGLLVLGSANLAAADSGSVAVHHVYNTGGDALYLHPDSPTIHSTLSDLMPEGAEFDISCWQNGDNVNGDAVWDFGTNAATGHTGFAADFYLDTPVTQGNEAAQLTSLGIQQCGNTTAPAEATAPPVNIQLNSNAGTREHAIQDLAPRLQVYQDWDVVMEPDDLVIRARLIYDEDFAFRMAAGYVRLLENEGMSGDWPLFMAYSLSPQVALQWKATGHSMKAATLDSLGINADVFIKRQQQYNDAKNAIG